MDVREKLVELIKNAPTTDVVYGSCKLCHPVQTVQTIADHLIAHGVTVQEWDGCEYCKAFTENDINGFFLPTTDPDFECAIVTIRFCPMCGRSLPQPPKGE